MSRRGRRSGGSSRWCATLLICVAGTVLRAGAQAPQTDPTPWPAPARAASRPNPLPKTAAVLKKGETVYRRDCEMCHGTRGAGDGKMAPSLPTKAANIATTKVQAQSDGALFWKIQQGRGVMPTTEVTLTDDERWAVVRFLRTLPRHR